MLFSVRWGAQALLGLGMEAAHPQLPLPAPGGALGGGWRPTLPNSLWQLVLGKASETQLLFCCWVWGVLFSFSLRYLENGCFT